MYKVVTTQPHFALPPPKIEKQCRLIGHSLQGPDMPPVQKPC